MGILHDEGVQPVDFRPEVRIAKVQLGKGPQRLANRDDVLRVLQKFDSTLDRFRSALARGDAKRLRQLLTLAKRRRDALAD